MSIIKNVTLQKNVAHDFRYDPRTKNIQYYMAWKGDCETLVNSVFGGNGLCLFDVFPSFALRR